MASRSTIAVRCHVVWFFVASAGLRASANSVAARASQRVLVRVQRHSVSRTDCRSYVRGARVVSPALGLTSPPNSGAVGRVQEHCRLGHTGSLFAHFFVARSRSDVAGGVETVALTRRSQTTFRTCSSCSKSRPTAAAARNAGAGGVGARRLAMTRKLAQHLSHAGRRASGRRCDVGHRPFRLLGAAAADRCWQIA